MTTPPLTRDEMAAKLRHESPTFVRYEATFPEIAARYLDGCMADQDRALREPWRHLTFDRSSRARGRNDWFTLDHGDILVGAPSESTWLSLYAQREGNTAPIMVRFCGPHDMRLLGQALVQAAEASEDLADPTHAGIKEAYRQAAIEQYAKDGEIEIDSNAVVSEGDDPGAYVQAWVWVDDETAEEATDEDC